MKMNVNVDIWVEGRTRTCTVSGSLEDCEAENLVRSSGLEPTSLSKMHTQVQLRCECPRA
jgi:hypothetical protein